VHLETLECQIVSESLAIQDRQIKSNDSAIKEGQIARDQNEACLYRWFRYALLVPTVARVHFLNLKPLVCILISTGSTWDIGTKEVCHTSGFWVSNVYPVRYSKTIPTTSCTIDTMTKVVRSVIVVS
jgi:hypothetical protein